MNSYSDVFRLLIESIKGSDVLIAVIAIFTVGIFVLMLIFAFTIKFKIKEWEKERNPKFTRWLCFGLKFTHTLFVTFISLFPLLGMLGTVLGLLGLDLSTGDMDNIRNNFFIALTSTAWGIIFSAIYKVLYALFADFVEGQIDAAQELTIDDK